jgi:hypothetical protein
MGHDLYVKLNDTDARIVFIDCGENESEDGLTWDCDGLLMVNDVHLGWAKVKFRRNRLTSIIEDADNLMKIQIYPKEEILK